MAEETPLCVLSGKFGFKKPAGVRTYCNRLFHRSACLKCHLQAKRVFAAVSKDANTDKALSTARQTRLAERCKQNINNQANQCDHGMTMFLKRLIPLTNL